MPASLLVLLAAACFGSTGTAVALGAGDASPASVGAARVVVGGALLAALALPVRHRPPHPRRGQGQAASRGRRLAVAGVGALGVVTYQPLFFAGTAANGVAVGTVTALGSAPLLTGALAWALTGDRPTRRWVLATLVAVAGLALLVLGTGTSTSTGSTGVDLPGVAASVGAGACYAVYTLATKHLLDAGWSPTATVGALFGGAAALSLPVLLAGDLTWLTGPATRTAAVATVLWLGVVTTALGYVLFSRGLRRLPAATVATLTLAEPLTATVLGLTVLHEQLTAADAGALLLIATGLVVLAAPARRRPQRTAVAGTPAPRRASQEVRQPTPEGRG